MNYSIKTVYETYENEKNTTNKKFDSRDLKKK